MDAIVPAAGRISGESAARTGTEVKALIPFDGVTLLERVLGCLRATDCIDRTVVIGPEEVGCHTAARMADAVLPEDASGPENILRGIEWLREAHGGRYPDRALIVTADLPFLTPEALNEFIDACPPQLDLCLPLISRAQFKNQFPGAPSTFVRLRDGEWTMGCAFLVNPEVIVANHAHIERVFEARKSQIAMVRLLGAAFILRFLTRRLTVRHLEERCLSMLGCTGGAILGCSPSLAFDIDSVEDYEFALEYLGTVARGEA